MYTWDYHWLFFYFRFFNIVVIITYSYQANVTYGDRIGARVMEHSLMAHTVKQSQSHISSRVTDGCKEHVKSQNVIFHGQTFDPHICQILQANYRFNIKTRYTEELYGGTHLVGMLPYFVIFLCDGLSVNCDLPDPDFSLLVPGQ
jgi:hypothetical protein